MCELNFSCYGEPPSNPPLDIQLTQLSLISVESLNILNQNDTTQSIAELVDFANTIFKQRLQADQITSICFNLVVI